MQTRRSIRIILLSALTSLGTLTAFAQIPEHDSRVVNLPGTDTHMAMPAFQNLKQWEARKAFLRQQILTSAGLSPMPAKTPLHPQVFGRTQGDGYTIEKVLLETMPGFYLGGNLYRPAGGTAKHPAILNPQGHWQYGRLENQPLYSGPSLGISLARQGYVVFAYDMVGYTDTVQIPHKIDSPEHRLWSFTLLGLQLWDSMRSLDFLESLPDVDPDRLGMTGASGGGTQTFLLTAVDDRIQFASPVNMVSAIMQGGDECENAPGLRIGTNNVEIAAMFAPKPMLLVSATGDWTHNVPNEEYPAIRRIYDLYSKGESVSVVQIKEEHNFSQQSREAVYNFLAKTNPDIAKEAELKEHDIVVPMLQDLVVLSNKSLPANATDIAGAMHLWQQMSLSALSEVHDPNARRELLRRTLAVSMPATEAGAVFSELHGSTLLLSRSDVRDRVTGMWFPGSGKIAVVLDPKGSASSRNTALVAQLLKAKRPVLLLDLFNTGGAIALRDQTDPAFLAFNPSDDSARVQDILTAMSYLRTGGKAASQIEIFANGDASIWATFAAAALPWHVDLHLESTPRLTTDADYLAHFNVPGILRAGGIAMAVNLAAQVR
jgi:hypothetical protein